MDIAFIESKIYDIRGMRVMLDSDLAELYGVENKRLKEAVRRNIERFPKDFMFEITFEEYKILRSQIASFNSNQKISSKYRPYAFTEQGIAMLSSILNSTTAIQVNIQIIRTFVVIRQLALNHADLTIKLKELESKFNKQFSDIYEAINFLLNKREQEKAHNERKRIGFK